jgi:hypothetical protein
MGKRKDQYQNLRMVELEFWVTPEIKKFIYINEKTTNDDFYQIMI